MKEQGREQMHSKLTHPRICIFDASSLECGMQTLEMAQQKHKLSSATDGQTLKNAAYCVHVLLTREHRTGGNRNGTERQGG